MITDNQKSFLDHVGSGYNTTVRYNDSEMNNILKAYVVSRLINGEDERMCIRATRKMKGWVHEFFRNIKRLLIEHGNGNIKLFNFYKVGFNTNELKLLTSSHNFRGTTNSTLIIDCTGDSYYPIETHGIIECSIVGIE